MFFTLIFNMGSLDVTVHSQESLLGRSAVSVSVADANGEEDKDAHHNEF